jgi:hypothetical protein
MRFNYLFALLTFGGVAIAAPVAAEAGAYFQSATNIDVTYI